MKVSRLKIRRHIPTVLVGGGIFVATTELLNLFLFSIAYRQVTNMIVAYYVESLEVLMPLTADGTDHF